VATHALDRRASRSEATCAVGKRCYCQLSSSCNTSLSNPDALTTLGKQGPVSDAEGLDFLQNARVVGNLPAMHTRHAQQQADGKAGARQGHVPCCPYETPDMYTLSAPYGWLIRAKRGPPKQACQGLVGASRQQPALTRTACGGTATAAAGCTPRLP